MVWRNGMWRRWWGKIWKSGKGRRRRCWRLISKVILPFHYALHGAGWLISINSWVESLNVEAKHLHSLSLNKTPNVRCNLKYSPKGLCLFLFTASCDQATCFKFFNYSGSRCTRISLFKWYVLSGPYCSLILIVDVSCIFADRETGLWGPSCSAAARLPALIW